MYYTYYVEPVTDFDIIPDPSYHRYLNKKDVALLKKY